jgi:hypothetical protein
MLFPQPCIETKNAYMGLNGDVEHEKAPSSSGHEMKRVTPDVRAPSRFRGRHFLSDPR